MKRAVTNVTLSFIPNQGFGVKKGVASLHLFAPLISKHPMGKKRIITTQGDQVNAEQKLTSSKRKIKKQVINGIAQIRVSYNNTNISITDLKGEVLAWSSSGSLGFKGTKKSTPYAANMVAKDCVEKSKKYNVANVKIVVKGVGPGRESAMRGLANSGLNIISIMDSTPIPHNGVRRKKPRRV